MVLKRVSSLWVGVGLGFGLLLAAWTAMLVIAHQQPVQVVPLVHQNGGGRP